MSTETFYITTPIYYPSDKLHIGHALTTTMADTLARLKRMQGYQVWFLTGSDEHGQKIQRKAEAQGVAPLEYVDPIVASFQRLWRELLISNDDFLRTSQERHQRVVQRLFRKIYDHGDIYRSQYEGWYCTQCEAFFTETQYQELSEGRCPDHDTPLEWLQEESYFFRLSKYAEQLLRHIETHPEFILPVSRRNEVVAFIKSGLEDLCVSSTSFSWGIPVPVAEGHVIYVWFDALTNYISALGWGEENDEKFQRFWPSVVHLVGKDIVRFHAIIWPIMLMAAGIDLPKQVVGHGWLLVDGGKMSKARGNVVDPLRLIAAYGADAIRYYLLRELPYAGDGYYSEEALVRRINTDLANDLGNLLSRSVTMVERYRGGVVPAPGPTGSAEDRLATLALEAPFEVERLLNAFEFSAALQAIWRLVNHCNKYIEETAPWNLVRDEAQAGYLDSVLYHLIEALRFIAVLITPFMPGLPDRIWPQLGLAANYESQTWASLSTWGALPVGTKVAKGEALFPRLNGPLAGESGPPQGREDAPAAKTPITIDDFTRLDLRVALVKAAEKVPRADRLLKLGLDLGDEERTVVAGIAQNYTPEELIGKKVVCLINLQPATLKGITSEGMVLAASGPDGMSLVTIERDLPPGTRVK